MNTIELGSCYTNGKYLFDCYVNSNHLKKLINYLENYNR